MMAERVIEYAVLLRRDLLRGGATATVPAHVPLVVYSGRAQWSPPLQVAERTEWVPDALVEFQPRMAFRFVDAKTYRGDHLSDGNVARAWLALEAADAAGLATALEHAAATFARVGDAALSHGLERWCYGVLRHRFGDRLRTLTDIMEKRTMLAETLQEWDEQKINEGRLEERARLRRLAERHFDAETANTLARLIEDEDERQEADRHFDAATARKFVRLINANDEPESP